jgi:hypothetical protein
MTFPRKQQEDPSPLTYGRRFQFGKYRAKAPGDGVRLPALRCACGAARAARCVLGWNS